MYKIALGKDHDHSKNTDFELLKRIRKIKEDFCNKNSQKGTIQEQTDNVLLKPFIYSKRGQDAKMLARQVLDNNYDYKAEDARIQLIVD